MNRGDEIALIASADEGAEAMDFGAGAGLRLQAGRP
jgi:hypothetical protein